MQPTSPAQFAATESGSVPGLEQVCDGVWALGQPMPNPQLPYTLSYLIVDSHDAVHIIDPAWNSEENFAILERALVELGSSVSRVASATMTHLHLDHTGLAGRLRSASGASIGISRIDHDTLERQAHVPSTIHTDDEVLAWGVPEQRVAELQERFMPDIGTVEVGADVLLEPGDQLDIPGRRISVLATPGHTAGSVCFLDRDARLLFTGDHLLPMIFPGIGLGGTTVENPVTTYVDSLDALAPFDGWQVLPGHGYRFTGLAERRAASAEHHNRRTREAAAVLGGHPEATTYEIASQLHWTAGWAGLEGPYLRSALAQTSMHADRVRRGDWAEYLAAHAG
ncbi:MBL fold metallo-hydrolase [Subtercola boreus]|uniref:Metallo-beta-lactamase domain-containing protein n=1 Tax=Subtercola boreus TaxID=120213 RepID=A0A3E0W9J1_9MICO|nr:MBL fold metallo-hydrolase [Subtercola boreus]RFA19044.1 hypothetical protein B7R24_12995 [Subtercola boreus]RFA19182.1 hypothetical protein B7R23_12975 [Subtercola boreus]RFA25644.1 hypothetical protein B7R25_13095 [Subtercola boreus]